jgi:Cdc6-like AAA superfamily ATPase
MKNVLLASWLGLVAAAALAQTHGDKELAEDIVRHRAMAAAHEGAAKCLEAKKGEKTCMAELQVACKGLGIGKQCGMRHVH